MPLISVIIPLYNSEKTIRSTLESVFKQSFSDWEIIAINDGSKDSTLDIVASIKDPRLKVFSYPNGGISVSRNRGLALAEGEFIAFLDHDDLWIADKLELQLKALQENPQAAVAYSWVDLIDESGEFIREGSRHKVQGNAYEKILVTDILSTASNPLICKSALVAVGGFDETVSGPEDWELFIRLAAEYEFVFVPKVQILFRMTAGSASANVYKQEVECLSVIEKVFARVPQPLQYLKKSSITNLYMTLTFRAIEVPLRRKNGWLAARFLWLAVKNDPALLRRRKTMLILLFKIATILILPYEQSKTFLKRLKQLKR